ncbi:MAG TPA: ABC transporter permease [Pyrinomonadaceae bacterium]
METKARESSSALGRADASPAGAHAAAGPQSAAAGAAHAPPVTVILSEESGVQLGLSDLWRYRELLYFLTWRDIKVRYKQTALGAAWAVIQPLAQMLLFTLVFHRFAGLGSGDMPYPLFAYAGLLVWTFFANAVLNSTHSLVTNTNLITKVYFPRVFIPAAAVAAGLVDLGIASVILAGLVAYYRIAPGWGAALLPLFIALAVLLSLAVGMLISATTVKYRDLRHALPFVMQFWMFATPVIYPSTVVPDGWRQVLALNPATGILEGFRASLTGGAIDRTLTVTAAVETVLLLALSFYVFRRNEETFADVI